MICLFAPFRCRKKGINQDAKDVNKIPSERQNRDNSGTPKKSNKSLSPSVAGTIPTIKSNSSDIPTEISLSFSTSDDDDMSLITSTTPSYRLNSRTQKLNQTWVQGSESKRILDARILHSKDTNLLEPRREVEDDKTDDNEVDSKSLFTRISI